VSIVSFFGRWLETHHHVRTGFLWPDEVGGSAFPFVQVGQHLLSCRVSKADLITIEPDDIYASRVFTEGIPDEVKPPQASLAGEGAPAH